MTRRTFPNEENRLVYGYTTAGAEVTSKAGATVTIYTDSACTTLASIQTEAGATISGSVLTISSDSRIPRFLGPDGTPFGVDTLYALVQGAVAPGEPVYARYDDRLDRDTVIRCTSGTRPTSPLDDQLIYETDTERIMRYHLATTTWIIVGGALSHFIARQNAVTATVNNVDTTVVFQAEDLDPDSQYNSATGVFTCSKPGIWLFTASLRFASNATGIRLCRITNSNGITSQSSVTSAALAGTGECSTSMIMNVTVGQTIQVKALQSSGGALNTLGDNTCLFSGSLLAALP